MTHVAYEDAVAYSRWGGKDLPTEAEWEFARSRRTRGCSVPVWGNDFAPDGRLLANTWQGRFPWENLPLDGLRAHRLWARFLQMGTVYTIWQATCGSGPATSSHAGMHLADEVVLHARRTTRRA